MNPIIVSSREMRGTQVVLILYSFFCLVHIIITSYNIKTSEKCCMENDNLYWFVHNLDTYKVRILIEVKECSIF